MPYSDNLYSMVDEDDSDAEIENPPHPSQQQSPFPPGPQQWPPATHGHAPRGNRDAHIDTAGWHAPSAADVDEQALSPSDGYFHGASSTAPSHTPTSSNVPYIPNVWVSDPSLGESSKAESKAREAYQESLANRDHSNAYRGFVPLAPGTGLGGTPFTSTQASSGDSRSRHDDYTPAPSTYSNPTGSTQAYASQAFGSVSGPSLSSGTATHTRRSSSAYTPSATASYRSYTPRRPEYERRPSLVPSEAPPAYTPSPTTSPTEADYSRNYNTFSQPEPTAVASNSSSNNNSNSSMGRPEETQSLLSGQPQSMGNPDGSYAGTTPAWKERVTRQGHRCKKILIGLLLFLVAFGFITSFATAVSEENPKEGFRGKRPAKGSPQPPKMSYPSIDDGDASWGFSDACKASRISRPTETFDVTFGAASPFTLRQELEDQRYGNYYRDVRVSGDVIFRRTGADTPGPSIVVEVVVNDESIPVGVEFDSSSQQLVITTPRSIAWDNTLAGPCVNLRATVWVPEDGQLGFLSVHTVHLNIKLLDNLSIQVASQTYLNSTVGHIVAASNGEDDEGLKHRGSPSSFVLNSRYIELKTISAPIRGAWPLYDYLGLQSTSGSIHVGIEPQPDAEGQEPKPAILYVRTTSGSVEALEKIDLAQSAFAASQISDQAAVAADQAVLQAKDYLPPRDYRVDVYSTSGTVHAALAFSSSCSIHTTSATVNADLLPLLDSSLAEGGSRQVSLETHTTSGSMTLNIADPLWIDTKAGLYAALGPDAAAQAAHAWRSLTSRHSSTSSSLRVFYPASWEGDIDLGTLSGSMSLKGKDVKLIRAGKDWPGVKKAVKARKGPEGGSTMTVRTTSGSITVQVGPEK